jgi:hypothetical protein
MPADRDTHRLVELGFDLFGLDWHGKFARMTKLSRPYISMIARGERPVTDAVKSAVAKGMLAEIKQLRGRAVEITKLLAEYER